MNDDAIVIENLKKSYKDTVVLDGINLRVEKGTMLALLGPNGVGKTTTVRILSTLLKYDSGSVSVNGFDVGKNPDKVRQNIGLTGQYAAVDEYLTGYENLVMMGRLYHLSKADSIKRARELLELFDLVDAAQRQVKSYSGGMRRRLDLAASLIATPPVIFLDEPTTGLDPRSRIAMWDVIRKLVEADATILLTTQYLDEADQLADKIAVMDNGKIIAQGTADELKQQVGMERLELVIAKDSDFASTVRLFAADKAQANEKNRTINLAVDKGVSDIQSTLSLLESNGIKVETLSLHKPTLDDVFLQLTGHAAEAESDDDSGKEQN